MRIRPWMFWPVLLAIALVVVSSADAASQMEAIVTLQTDLRVLGFSPGPIDGIVGESTVAAVKKYAANNGIVWSDATLLPILKLIMLDARISGPGKPRTAQSRAWGAPCRTCPTRPGRGDALRHPGHLERVGGAA